MSNPTIDTLVGGIRRTLGSYGPIIAELEEAINDPRSNLVDVGGVVGKDPDVTLRLLKLANSAFYGFPTRLATVSDAISVIGMVQVQDLLLASSVIEAFAGVSEEFVDMESFWRHSLACGIGARVLAIAQRLPQPEKFFVAGLMHDLGRLVLYSQAPESAEAVFACYHSDRLLLRDAEIRVLTFDHAQIGRALLGRWLYPAELVEAVAFHHQPMTAATYVTEAAVVHVADHLVNALQLGSSGERFVPRLNSQAWKHLGLTGGILDSVVTTIDEQLAVVEEVFLPARPVRSPG